MKLPTELTNLIESYLSFPAESTRADITPLVTAAYKASLQHTGIAHTIMQSEQSLVIYKLVNAGTADEAISYEIFDLVAHTTHVPNPFNPQPTTTNE